MLRIETASNQLNASLASTVARQLKPSACVCFVRVYVLFRFLTIAGRFCFVLFFFLKSTYLVIVFPGEIWPVVECTCRLLTCIHRRPECNALAAYVIDERSWVFPFRLTYRINWPDESTYWPPFAIRTRSIGPRIRRCFEYRIYLYVDLIISAASYLQYNWGLDISRNFMKLNKCNKQNFYIALQSCKML